MTVSRLYQQTSGTTTSMGVVVLTFPPVPTGLVWTGSVMLYTPPDSIQALMGSEWSMTRNGNAVLSFQTMAVVADLQLVGGEVLQLIGSYINPNVQITATWMGRSEAAGTAAAVAPVVYGSPSPVSQVWNDTTQPIGSPVLVTDGRLPNPAVMQSAWQAVSAVSTTLSIMAAPVSAYQIWEIGLTMTGSQLAAVAGEQFVTASVQTTDATPKVLMKVGVMTVPGTTDAVSLTLPFHGLTLNAGKTLQLVTGAYGGTALSAQVSVVYND